MSRPQKRSPEKCTTDCLGCTVLNKIQSLVNSRGITDQLVINRMAARAQVDRCPDGKTLNTNLVHTFIPRGVYKTPY